MVNGASTGTALAAVAAWLALATVGGLSALGVAVPLPAAAACALLAGPVALAGLIEAVTSFWRGPAIVAFPPHEAVSCTTAEATFVRAAARLRGTMGGAGHLHPRRIAFPAVAWGAATIVGAEALVAPVHRFAGPWPLLLTITAACAAFLFPARPYFYRETTGGGAIVSPPPEALWLKARAAARAGSRAADPSTPAPTPTPTPEGLAVSRAPERDPVA